MGCFVHVILLGMGCFVSLQKNMWWFLSTYNKMDVGGYVRGVFCPYTTINKGLKQSTTVEVMIINFAKFGSADFKQKVL